MDRALGTQVICAAVLGFPKLSHFQTLEKCFAHIATIILNAVF
jgi:hypothetical protein